SDDARGGIVPLRALMPPACVKPYVKRQKNDATDAEAICEAVSRSNMRFVATKTPEQQSCLMLHHARHLFIRQRTAVINAIRAHFAEFGIVVTVGKTPAAHRPGPNREQTPRISTSRTCTFPTCSAGYCRDGR